MGREKGRQRVVRKEVGGENEIKWNVLNMVLFALLFLRMVPISLGLVTPSPTINETGSNLAHRNELPTKGKSITTSQGSSIKLSARPCLS